MALTLDLTKKKGKKKGMTGAERSAKRRRKVREGGGRVITIELQSYVIDIINQFRKEFTGDSLSKQIENILLGWSIDALESMPELRLKAKLRDEKLKGASHDQTN